MNNPRLMVWLAFAAVLVLNYEAWVHDYGAADNAAATHAAAPAGAHATSGNLDSAVPQTFSTDTTAPPAAAAPGTASTAPNAPSAEPAVSAAPHVHVRTDVLDMDISLQGGTLQKADLLRIV